VPETVVQTIRIGGKKGEDMNTPFDGCRRGPTASSMSGRSGGDLPDDVREQVGEAEVVYSVHAPDGQRLALVADRKLAFHLAKAHDFAPQSVH
jgi:hypothetical protein